LLRVRVAWHSYQDTTQPLGKPVVVGDEAARKKLPEGKKW
jgi:hypothetical protein